MNLKEIWKWITQIFWFGFAFALWCFLGWKYLFRNEWEKELADFTKQEAKA